MPDPEGAPSPPRRREALEFRRIVAAWRSLERLGGAFMVLLLVSGVIVAMDYDADPATAHDDVAALQVGADRAVRSTHYWAATGLLLTAILLPAHRWIAAGPEVLRLTRWVLWVGIFVLAAAGFMSGRILAWDQHGWESWSHVQTAASMRADPEPIHTPLGWIYAAHLLILPALGSLAWLLAGRPSLHALARGWSTRMPRALLDAWSPSVALVAVALLWPPPLGPEPIPGLFVSKPDWPFLWLSPLQAWWGPWGLRVGLGGLGFLMLVQPWAVPRMTPRARGWALLGFLALVLGLTVLGAES